LIGRADEKLTAFVELEVAITLDTLA